MMKNKIKVLWFEAEDKAVEYSKHGLFQTLSKLLHTAVMLLMCLVIFAVYGTIELLLYAKKRFIDKEPTVETDEYSVPEGLNMPDKIEPNTNQTEDPAERIRKWM
jgi:hypothetical protein